MVVTEALKVTSVPQVEVVVAPPPDVIVKAVAVADPTPRMVMGNGVVAESAPDVPVMVAVVVPGGTELFAVSVRTLLVVEDAGFQLPVTPAGSPVTENVTLPVNPLAPMTPTVVLPLAAG